MLTRNSTHAHNNGDEMNPPVPHLRRIIAIVGMQAEAHVDTCLHRKILNKNETVTRKTCKAYKADKAYTNGTPVTAKVD